MAGLPFSTVDLAFPVVGLDFTSDDLADFETFGFEIADFEATDLGVAGLEFLGSVVLGSVVWA